MLFLDRPHYFSPTIKFLLVKINKHTLAKLLYHCVTIFDQIHSTSLIYNNKGQYTVPYLYMAMKGHYTVIGLHELFKYWSCWLRKIQNKQILLPTDPILHSYTCIEQGKKPICFLLDLWKIIVLSLSFLQYCFSCLIGIKSATVVYKNLEQCTNYI